MNKLLASSADPEKLSFTIQGMIAALVPVVGLLLKTMGHEIDNDTLQAFTNTLSNIVVLLGSLAAAFMMLAGIARKIYLGLVNE